jgi:hypothetical protein
VYLGERVLECASTALLTLLHERFHAYQHDVRRGLIESPNKDIWQKSMIGRIAPPPFSLEEIDPSDEFEVQWYHERMAHYKLQRIERDADDFVVQFCTQVFKDFRYEVLKDIVFATNFERVMHVNVFRELGIANNASEAFERVDEVVAEDYTRRTGKPFSEPAPAELGEDKQSCYSKKTSFSMERGRGHSVKRDI